MPLTTIPNDPFALFDEWYREAAAHELNDPNAMSLATVNAQGEPSVRMVLLKDYQSGGFSFFTNTQSRKGQDIAANPNVALCFHWKSLKRQVRVEGVVYEVSAEEADAYFSNRPIGAQIGAWASQQSSPLESRELLEEKVADYAMKFGDNSVPRPPYWSGFRVIPKCIEFWVDRPFRLHDRILYTYEGPNSWSITRLNP